MKVYIVLQNGKIFEGESFGSEREVVGEIVFTTGVVGFTETITDPSYYGQIVVQTFPTIGNYGVAYADMERNCSALKAYVVREYCQKPSNFRMDTTLDEFLKEMNVVGVCGVDTRELTRIIRENGVMNAAVVTDPKSVDLSKLAKYSIKNAVDAVTDKIIEHFPVEGSKKCTVALYDYGAKVNIIRSLNARGCEVISYPAWTSASEILAAHPDGVMLSNGPGDPAENLTEISAIKELFGKVPMFGICLGHQLMALAAGGSTVKLKYGHRGANQPVKELSSGKTVITCQNHGYAVDAAALPNWAKVTHVNANDGTCEGVEYLGKKAFSAQFHPEACAGPRDSVSLFDKFVDLMTEGK